MKKRITAIMLVAVLLLMPMTNMTVLAADNEVLELYGLPINGFQSQDGDSPAKVYEEKNGNQYFKLKYKSSDYSTFYFSTEKVINQDGIYTFEADIRYNADLKTDNIFISLFGEDEAFSKTIATNVKALNSMVTPIKNSDWKKLSVTFEVKDYFLKGYEAFKFGFNTMGEKNNYIDIDNISLSLCSAIEFGTKNVDAGKNGDLQSFEATYDFDEVGWHGNETYYIDDLGVENQIISSGNNRILKLYTSDRSNTSITKALNMNLAKPGWYKLIFKAKAGSDFYTDNIGFRISDETGVGTHVGETNISYKDINADTWVTVETPFYVSQKSTSPWLNLDLWVFTHSDQSEHQKENNYLLVDDIQIVEKVSGGISGENLFEAGEISGFKASQGRKTYNISYANLVKEYPYVKHVIPVNTLDQFATGKKFTENRAEENWWGTMSNDISAEMLDIDGYHAALLAHDGKQVTKTFSTLSYVLSLVEFSTQKYYTLEFDYKLENVDTDVVRVAFIGSENLDDYMLNLATAKAGVNYTEGVNKDLFTYVIEEKEDGWRHLRFIFKPNIEFKSRVSTLRFLNYTNFNPDNKLYVANIEMSEYSSEEYTAYAQEDAVKTAMSGFGGKENVMIIIGSVGIVGTTAMIAVMVISQKRKKRGVKNDEK